jgi:hypothetical protein
MPAPSETRHLRTHSDCDRLAGFGNDPDNRAHVQNLPNRHRDRTRWNVADCREPPFTHLLTATRIVELDDEIRALGVEIRGRIVECEVAVLANPDERHIDRLRRQLSAEILAHRVRIATTVDQMDAYDSGRFNQPFAQVLPKARRMIVRQADVFIEMKQLDRRPVEIGARQSIEELHLRRSCCYDNAGLTGRGDSCPDARGRVARRRARQRDLIGEDRKAHAGRAKVLHAARANGPPSSGAAVVGGPPQHLELMA